MFFEAAVSGATLPACAKPRNTDWLGDYRVLRYRAVIRHMRLVDCAYPCPIRIGIKAYRAKGQNESNKVLRLEPISKLKDGMRRILWQENVQDVIKHRHEKPVIRRLEKLLAA